MKPALAIALGCLLAAWGCGGDDDDADAGNACSYDMCYATCEEQHAADLEDCNDICAIEAYCTTDDVCSCHFYPCHNDECVAWCQENTDLDGGACDLLTCECF